MQQPLVDVIVLNHNGRKFLDDCLLSVRKTTYPNYKVHLLDNASTDDSVEYVCANYPEVNIIRNPLNNGYCAAYNIAFGICTGTYFLCLNNDVEVEPGWLDHLVSVAEADTSIAALQPKLVSFFDHKQFEYAGSSGGLMDVYAYPFLRGRVFETIEADEGQYNDTTDIFWACGAALFLRASVLEKSGLLDESFVHHMDEIDLCWRIHLAGYKIKVVPASVVAHYGGATIQAQSFKKMYWNHRNSLFMMMKNYGAAQCLRKTLVHLILDYVAVASSIFSFQFTRARAVLWAHLWILLNLPLIMRKRREVQQLRVVNDEVVMRQMYPRSVVLQYFVHKKKTWLQLKKIIYADQTGSRAPQRVENIRT